MMIIQTKPRARAKKMVAIKKFEVSDKSSTIDTTNPRAFVMISIYFLSKAKLAWDLMASFRVGTHILPNTRVMGELSTCDWGVTSLGGVDELCCGIR